MNKDFLKQHEENREKIKQKAGEVAEIAKLAKKAFDETFTEGIGNVESTFILGFISGYKTKYFPSPKIENKGWDCPTSPTGHCDYEQEDGSFDEDSCRYCGHPDERK